MAFGTERQGYAPRKGFVAVGQPRIESMIMVGAGQAEVGEFMSFNTARDGVNKLSAANLIYNASAGTGNGAGIIVRDPDNPGGNDLFEAGEVVPILIMGQVYILAAEAVTAGAVVTVDADNGRNYHDDNSGIFVPGHRWRTAVASGQLGLVDVSFAAYASRGQNS